MVIQELTCCSDVQFEDIKALIAELTDRVVLTREALESVLKDGASHLYCAMDDGRIVGCATLCIYNSPTGTKGTIEDVVVDREYRGRHLGRQLMFHLIQEAAAYAPIELGLTSKPSRVAANALYQSLGFIPKSTNVYRLLIG